MDKKIQSIIAYVERQSMHVKAATIAGVAAIVVGIFARTTKRGIKHK